MDAPFLSWPLRPELLTSLQAQGFTDPTDVQKATFPAVLEGRDVVVQSRTGTGKTLAFGLPLLQRLERGRGPVEVLIVLPTRELAAQVAGALGKLAEAVGVGVLVIAGGGSYRDQHMGLKGGAKVIVGTPGRLVDHIERKSLDLTRCVTLVLDEADEMLDMGFAEDLDKITAALPESRQTLLFSATLPSETRALAAKNLREPVTISVSIGLTAAPEIHHVAYECHREYKLDALVNVLHVENPALALIFCHTKVETEAVAERLGAEDFEVAFLHGDLAQAERNRTLAAFRRRQVRLLVATDVAARGIDVKGVTHVFNLGVTAQAETYVHRVGRTGRAGQSGTAVTFVPPQDMSRFRRILGKASIQLELRTVPQVEEVRARLRAGFQAALAETVTSVEPRIRSLADDLLAQMGPTDLVAALLQGNPAASALYDAGRDVPVPRPKRGPVRPGPFDGPPGPSGPPRDDARRDDRPPRKLSEWQDPGMERIWLGVGREHGLNPARLVSMASNEARVPREAFGPIAIHAWFTFFDVQDREAERVVETMRRLTWDGRPMRANLVPRVGEGGGPSARSGPPRRR